VERALWELCRNPNKPGFEEDEIRKQCVRFGGPAMGEFFDRVVMKPGELPIEEQLKKVGLELAQVEETYVDPLIDVSPIFGGGNGVRVARVRGEADTVGLKSDDVVLEINGASMASASSQEAAGKANAAIRAAKAGDAIKVKVRRAGEEKEFVVRAVEAKRSLWKVLDGKVADAEKLALRKGWYYAGKKK
jgi:predicted metalloprotease with PDZ domain